MRCPTQPVLPIPAQPVEDGVESPASVSAEPPRSAIGSHRQDHVEQRRSLVEGQEHAVPQRDHHLRLTVPSGVAGRSPDDLLRGQGELPR